MNFALVGTEQQVQAALAKAGWIPTDPNTRDALLHGLIATLSHKEWIGLCIRNGMVYAEPSPWQPHY